MSLSLRYVAPPTVSRMMESNGFVRAIVGPFGSGKSSGCVMEIIARALGQEPNAQKVRRTRFAVVRNTGPQLQDTTRKTFDEWCGLLGEWSETDFTFLIDRPLKDGTRMHCEVLFRALDRPQDVKKLLSLELTGAYINEAREIPKEILDGLQGRVGRYPPRKDGGGATWDGVWMDTNPWHVGSWGHTLFSVEKPPGFELFEQPSGLSPDAENVENLKPGYYRRLCHGKDQEWIDEYVHGKYPKSDKGSVYGELVAKLEERGGICDFEHPSDGVFCNFDLGVSDATAIWWWRIGPDGVPDVIDWYENNGESASHYFGVLRERPWKLTKIWLPHDARQREFGTGVSVLNLFLKEFGEDKVAIGPELNVRNGIAAGRWLLEQPIRIHKSRCAEGVRRLRAYRYAWDEEKKVFSKTPVHDWTSHTADDWRYLAQVAQFTERMMRPEERKPPPPPIVEKPITLDELFEAAENDAALKRERI